MILDGHPRSETSQRPLALILGATGGIGQAFCYALAQQGFDLIISGRNRATLESLAAELNAKHKIAVEQRVWDLARPEDIDAIATFLQETKRLNWFINASGQAIWGRFSELPLKSQIELFQVNLISSVQLLHAAINALKDRHQASIICVASAAGFFSVPYLSSYCATKSGLVQLVVSVHEEHAATGLRIQALCPGFVKTAMFSKAGADVDRLPRGIWLSPERIVRESLIGIQRNKAIVIPGKRYRWMLWGANWVPASIYRRITGWLFESRERFGLRTDIASEEPSRG